MKCKDLFRGLHVIHREKKTSLTLKGLCINVSNVYTAVYLSPFSYRFLHSHQTNHGVLIENPHIVNWRKKYVTLIRKYKKDGRSIFYFDESYIHQNHMPSRILTDTTIQSAEDAKERGLTTGVKRPAGKGQRLIMMAMVAIVNAVMM